jgi:hypothetical protein
MRKLKIDLSELESAFESSGEYFSYYLNTETGAILLVTEDDRYLLEQIYESHYNKQTETVDWDAASEAFQLSEAERESIQELDQLEEDYGTRLIDIPAQSSHEGYRDMEAFIATVRSPRLQERLERAISGRGAFRYFKDVLIDYPAERERWFKFKQERLFERILDWLESIGIAPE